MNRLARGLVVIAVVALVAVLCGCGGSGGSAGSTGPSVVTAGKPPPPPPPPSTPSKIAYQSAGQVYVMNTDGTGKTALRAGSVPSWSPDGTKIAYEYSNCIWVMNADGTQPVALTQQVTLTEPKALGHLSADRTPDWSPDGNYLVFVRGDLSTGFYFSLRVVAATGGTPTKIVDLFAENPYLVFPTLLWPAWSPNGDFIAFSREYQRPDSTMTNLLRVLPMSGPSPTGPMVDLLEGARYPGWKNDGTALTFAKMGVPSSLWNALFSAGPPPALGAQTQLTTSSYDCRPRWSPDDTQIVYSSDGTRQNVRDIYVVPAAGGTPTNLTNSARVDDAFPDWSPAVF